MRSATTADVPWLVAQEVACFGDAAWGQVLVAEAVESGQVFVAGDGYVVVRVVAETADLDRIAVAPSSRRRGVGKVLLAECLSEATSRGAERMLLEVAADNGPALALYESAGFIEIHRRVRYYPSGADAVIMERALD